MTKKEDIIIMNFSGIYKQQQFWRTGEIQRKYFLGGGTGASGKQLLLRWRWQRRLLRQKLEEFDADGNPFH